jgi:hypothetical protein
MREPDNLITICELTVLDNVGSSISHNPIGLHGLLQGQLYFTYSLVTWQASHMSYSILAPNIFVTTVR